MAAPAIKGRVPRSPFSRAALRDANGRSVALFIDTFVNKIDRKGRISVPASYRAALAGQVFQGIVAFPSFKYPAIQCAGMDWMTALTENVGRVDLFSDEHDDLTATLFADAKQLAFDGEGRVMLPEILTAHAKIDEAAAFVGRGHTFEIWQPAALEAYKAEARRRALEKGRTLPRGGGGGA
jgi:MraZ protein